MASNVFRLNGVNLEAPTFDESGYATGLEDGATYSYDMRTGKVARVSPPPPRTSGVTAEPLPPAFTPRQPRLKPEQYLEVPPEGIVQESSRWDVKPVPVEPADAPGGFLRPFKNFLYDTAQAAVEPYTAGRGAVDNGLASLTPSAMATPGGTAMFALGAADEAGSRIPGLKEASNAAQALNQLALPLDPMGTGMREMAMSGIENAPVSTTLSALTPMGPKGVGGVRPPMPPAPTATAPAGMVNRVRTILGMPKPPAPPSPGTVSPGAVDAVQQALEQGRMGSTFRPTPGPGAFNVPEEAITNAQIQRLRDMGFTREAMAATPEPAHATPLKELGERLAARRVGETTGVVRPTRGGRPVTYGDRTQGQTTGELAEFLTGSISRAERSLGTDDVLLALGQEKTGGGTPTALARGVREAIANKTALNQAHTARLVERLQAEGQSGATLKRTLDRYERAGLISGETRSRLGHGRLGSTGGRFQPMRRDSGGRPTGPVKTGNELAEHVFEEGLPSASSAPIRTADVGGPVYRPELVQADLQAQAYIESRQVYNYMSDLRNMAAKDPAAFAGKAGAEKLNFLLSHGRMRAALERLDSRIHGLEAQELTQPDLRRLIRQAWDDVGDDTTYKTWKHNVESRVEEMGARGAAESVAEDINRALADPSADITAALQRAKAITQEYGRPRLVRGRPPVAGQYHGSGVQHDVERAFGRTIQGMRYAGIEPTPESFTAVYNTARGRMTKKEIKRLFGGKDEEAIRALYLRALQERQ